NSIKPDEDYYPEKVLRESVYGIDEVKVKKEFGVNEEPIKIGDVGLKLKEDVEINYQPIYFTDENYLVKHESSINGQLGTNTCEASYQCSQYDKAFSKNCNLIQQQRPHTGERPYQCSQY
ncbi:unnamed protein product, partial [Meganyctiphanes norvegica]